MKRTWTIIGVRDVPGSFKWYQSLFGQPETPPGHDYFGQILDEDGTVLLCLHQWGAHEHPSLMSPDEAPPGNGLLLFFRVDDFDMALKRARVLVTRFEEESHVNPNTQTREFSLRDPDGYYITLSALSGRLPNLARAEVRLKLFRNRDGAVRLLEIFDQCCK
jgi:catechol 2,3-dioxygenase-like lactoylglutathione lyase family enzyme